MILEYTEAESLEWKAINDKYEKTAQRITEAGIAYLDLEAVKEVFVKDTETRAKWLAELEALHDEIENRRIAAIKDDPEALLQELQKQMHLAITRAVTDIVSQEVKDRQGEAMEKEFVTAKQEGREPQFVKVDYRAVYDEMTASPIFTPEQARQIIEQEARKILDALQPYNKDADIEKAFSGFFGKSPFVIKGGSLAAKEKRAPLQSIKTYGLMNDKLAAQILQDSAFRREANGQLALIWEVNEAPDKREPVPVSIALSYEGEETKLTRKMTAFDEAVHNAVATCFYYHKKNNGNAPLYITPQEIWRVMTGEADKRKTPSQKQIARVCASMDKMRFTRVYLDATKEVEAKYLVTEDDRIKSGMIDTTLLKADKALITTEKGREISAYRIEAEPILYTYQAAKNRVLWVQYALLDVSEKTGNEGETIVIRDYLLRQIELMKKNARNSTRILYGTLYTATALPTPEVRVKRENFTSDNAYKTAIKKEAKKDRDKVAAILEAWIEKDHIIGFSPEKKGKSFAGIDIILTQKQLEELKKSGREVIDKAALKNRQN